jgi:hypothetical protein
VIGPPPHMRSAPPFSRVFGVFVVFCGLLGRSRACFWVTPKGFVMKWRDGAAISSDYDRYSRGLEDE